VQKKQYCIFNKQYTKEEYEALVSKIIQHMNEMPYVDKRGRIYRYGEFFPSELALFAYNESLAFSDFPLTKEQAIAEGYTWQESEEKDYKITLEPEAIPDNIKDVTDDIIKESVGCAHRGKCSCKCTTAFKITKQELDFYRTNDLPIPRLCHNCRHVRRSKNQRPLKLWHRRCMCDKQHTQHSGRCPNEFETSYAPDRPEIVYCESCYNNEVA
jgi:hypothetical protein